jgi:hypothetical protein
MESHRTACSPGRCATGVHADWRVHHVQTGSGTARFGSLPSDEFVRRVTLCERLYPHLPPPTPRYNIEAPAEASKVLHSWRDVQNAKKKMTGCIFFRINLRAVCVEQLYKQYKSDGYKIEKVDFEDALMDYEMTMTELWSDTYFSQAYK